ncbi:unnamed protein product [Zymoseptoria tritici ST99CH_3D1]|nr:unnamed protein product [Zymoseptoria tritici ST99CH_3D1]
MSFPFSEICTLLQRLEDVELHYPAFLPPQKVVRNRELVESWFKSHRRHINELHVHGSTALLSAILPERRTDRVYGIQEQSLCRILGRALGLGASRRPDLEAYKRFGSGDLAECLERVLKAGGQEATRGNAAVTLEEVDDMLQLLAGNCRFSDPSIPRLPPGSSEARDAPLVYILKRIGPQEGKWLCRLILKNLKPLCIDENLILKNFHFLLPDLLRFQRDFEAAVSLLKGELAEYHSNPDPRSQRLLREAASSKIRPRVGTKVGRPTFHKARGIDYCLDTMLKGKKWNLERKYDGEYCEVHIDLSRSSVPAECIQIFSKSGKDSTMDRSLIHRTLVDSLRLGRPDCKFKKQLIILGELVVYSDKEHRVLPFETIRKYVTRSGVPLGTEKDSQRHAHEHLAIVFFDLLLLDDEIVMSKPVDERRIWLREAYQKIPGRVMAAEWKVVNFDGSSKAKKSLMQQFGMSIAHRCEGLILKPCEVPYFSLDGSNDDYKKSFIKVKKDYISGLGDEEDFSIIGASYHAAQQPVNASRLIKWNTFYLGCLMNKEDVQRLDSKPIFKHVGTVDQEHCIPKAVLETANILGRLSEQPYTSIQSSRKFDVVSASTVKMSVVFEKPLVFEVLGSGFVKPSDCDFLMLRHPRVKKLHEDRTWLDCVTFQELQQHGKAARAAPDSESQETARWLDKLEASCKRKVDRQSTISPRRRAATVTPRRSPVNASTPATSPPEPAAVQACASRAIRDMASSPKPPSSPLDHATQVGPTRPSLGKRRSEDEHEARRPVAKRQRTLSELAPRSHGSKTSQAPLAEITVNIKVPSDPPASAQSDRGSEAFVNLTRKIMSWVRPSRKLGHDANIVSRATCESSTCAFSNAVIVLAPCIAHTPYITEDLLACHGATVARDIKHWDRDSFAHPRLTETVSESQSYPGMRKVVLVEGKRGEQVRALVKQIRRLNSGQFRERVEVYDWRVLEECLDHGKGAGLLKRHFIGATLFDDTQKRVLFVGEGDYLDS